MHPCPQIVGPQKLWFVAVMVVKSVRRILWDFMGLSLDETNQDPANICWLMAGPSLHLSWAALHWHSNF